MGHEKASTTLDMYTHATSDQESRKRVLGAFAAFSLPLDATDTDARGEEEDCQAV
jgi:hypothetical protein